MLAKKVIVVPVIIFVLSIVGRADIVELKSADEIDDFVRTLDIRVIYFETKDAQTKYPLFIEEYTQSSISLESYGVQFGKVNCSTVGHKYCSEPSDASLFVFKDEKLLKSFPIKKLNNEHSIVANILHRFLLKDELIVVQTEEDLEKILADARGKENVIVTNVKEIGMKDHRNLLEVAFAFGDTFKFYLTTKLPKHIYGTDSKLKAFLCKEGKCDVRHYNNEFRVISLATFLQSLTLPQAVIFGEDEKTPYTNKDVVSIPINRVYMFVRNHKDPEAYRAELEEIARKVRSAVGFIVVQVEKHPGFLRHFGLAEDSAFPALGFIPGHKSGDDDAQEFEYVDVFTSREKSLNAENLVDLVYNLISHPAEVFGSSSERRSLTLNSPVEYLSLLEKLETEYLLVAFCKPSVEACVDLSYEYQRLSRTYDRHFDRSGTRKRNIKFSIIFNDRGMAPEFKVEKYPTIRLHKKDQPIDEFTLYTGTSSYYDMVDFIEKQINEPDVKVLPASGLDYIDIQSIRNGGEKVVGKGDEDNPEEAEEPEDYEEEERPPEETEDDEVAAAGYELYYTKAVDDSHIPKLNDTSFNSTIRQYDTSVVFFFLPWDARSQAFSPSYAAAAKKIVEPDGSGVKIGVLQVNCFDWEDVCSKENIKLYPTVRFYRRKQPPMDYNGVLDESSLVKTVKLLQAPSPLKLSSDGEAVGFQEGKYPMTSILYADVSVLGLFSVVNSDYVSSFTSAARAMEGQFLCGYATGKVASDAASKLGVPVPSIVLVKRNDPLQSKVVYDGEYTEEAIVQFVKHASLPVYGELTPLNFPAYFSKGQPFLVAFIKKDNVDVNSLIADVVKSGETGGVNFCWVDISVEMNRDILMAYSQSDKDKSDMTSAIVLVYHQKGITYNYKGELQKEKLVFWIKSCLSGSETFTHALKTKEWKPRLEGYDFLAKMKEESGNEGAEDGKTLDPWEDTEPESDDDDDDNKRYDDDSTDPEPDHDHHTRLHAAFHAKKQSRLDQRRRIDPKPVHEPHSEL
ncbi:thioredoxin domain-containing protein 16-like [Dendronephthya gigantea]|uniref:thioredoxin domain-containing protein 16-like n=1 Tax=Dendronephthya gigantea TaxID=151771 RepID=UPI001069AA38|nr:thioredoxin domain-containing protein 16-like [Dendronephthya gigantea]